jgi:hypothetical protein
MSTSAGLFIVEELREGIQRLEGAVARRQTVLPFKEICREADWRSARCMRWPVAVMARSTVRPRLSSRRELPLGPAAGCCGASFGRTSSLRPLRKQGCCHPPLAAADRSRRLRTAKASVTRWRVSVLPSTPLPVPGVGRARWQVELIQCRADESADFEVEACDAKGRLALPSDLVHGSGQKEIGRRRAAG